MTTREKASKICTCRHDSGASSVCVVHSGGSEALPTHPDLESLALAYHKADRPEGDGEYGCPGLECPGVKRIVKFVRSCIEADRARLQQQLDDLTMKCGHQLFTALKDLKAVEQARDTALQALEEMKKEQDTRGDGERRAAGPAGSTAASA